MIATVTGIENPGQTYQMPPAIAAGFHAYVEHRRKVGGFLTAVLTNNLVLAVNRADAESTECLAQIVQYMFNELPSDSWGSREIVARWLGIPEGDL